MLNRLYAQKLVGCKLILFSSLFDLIQRIRKNGSFISLTPNSMTQADMLKCQNYTQKNKKKRIHTDLHRIGTTCRSIYCFEYKIGIS